MTIKIHDDNTFVNEMDIINASKLLDTKKVVIEDHEVIINNHVFDDIYFCTAYIRVDSLELLDMMHPYEFFRRHNIIGLNSIGWHINNWKIDERDKTLEENIEEIKHRVQLLLKSVMEAKNETK